MILRKRKNLNAVSLHSDIRQKFSIYFLIQSYHKSNFYVTILFQEIVNTTSTSVNTRIDITTINSKKRTILLIIT